MDPISLDNVLRIIEIVSVIGGGGMIAYRLGRSTEKMEAAINAQALVSKQQHQEIHELKSEVKKIGEVVIQVATQKVAMESLSHQLRLLDQRYEELRHGKGFVYPFGEHIAQK